MMLKRIFLILLLLFSTQVFAISETQIKAVFLEKFTHLIEWPKKEHKKFTICIINDKKFANALEDLYENKKFNNLNVDIKYLSSTNNIPKCQLLYIGKNTKNTKKIIKKLNDSPVLTVTDDKNFIDDEVMITIFLKQKKFKYIINNKAAKEADMKISYLLLKSAQEVK